MRFSLCKQPLPKDAARVLYETYYADVVRQVVAVTGDVECAVESTQEAFLRAFERFDTLRDHSSFSSWVTSIALNAARDTFRKRGRELSIGEKLASLPSGNRSLMVEEEACDKESTYAVREAVRSLPLDLRTVIILFYVQDLDIQSISRILGIPAGTVKSRLSRARAWLRGKMNGEECLLADER